MQRKSNPAQYLRTRYALIFCAALFAHSQLSSSALATYTDLIGFPQLQNQLGASIPTGSGISVQQVEAPEAGVRYMPAVGASPHAELVGKSLLNQTLSAGVNQANTGVSSHAERVALNFYGSTTSIAPNISNVESYEANHWLGYEITGSSLAVTPTGFLNNQSTGAPNTTTARISNHSWVGGLGSSSIDGEVLRRTDFIVDQDDLIVVAGLPNSSNNSPYFKSAYNEISVGLTSGNHLGTTVAVDSLYTAGRVAPDLVAPGFQPNNNATPFTSFATPMVSAASALLLETGQNSALSNGMITNRTRTIYHAETSEVIKAVLMAGADRDVDNIRGADLNDYAIDTSNNLDHDYGAGQLNIFNSYNILAAGEHDSNEDAGSSSDIGNLGWDYDANFGGDAGTNNVGTYQFTAGSNNDVLTATLAWNIDVDLVAATLYDFDLELYDVTNSSVVTGAGASSMSTTENTENIFYNGLIAGNQYELRVKRGAGQSAIDADYAIAWSVKTIPEPGTLALALISTFALASQRRRMR